MGVVTEVLEKVVGINWGTLAVPFVAFASSSQSFWQSSTSEPWGGWKSKYFFLDKQLGDLHIHIWDVVLQTKHFLF